MTTLTKFLVGLSFDTDKASYNQAMSDVKKFGRETIGTAGKITGAFSLLSSAMAVKMTTLDYTKDISNLGRLSDALGMTVNDIRALGTVSEKEGGGLDVLISQLDYIKTFRTLSPIELSEKFASLGLVGIDPNVVLSAENTQEAYLNLLEVISKFDEARQRQAMRALGFDDSFLRMAKQGREEIEAAIELEKKRRSLNENASEDAQNFEKELIDLKNNLGDISDAFSQSMLIGLTDTIKEATISF